MRIHVEHAIGGLRRDLQTIATTTPAKLSRVVKRNTAQGTTLAKRFAREASGIHGLNYYKRISGELVAPLTGEFGPEGTVAGNAVGAGWRHGAGNTDLPKAADIQGPKLARDIGEIADAAFWP